MNDLISRQTAIKAIEDLPNCYNGFSDTYDKAYIIGTLEELPSAQLSPCDVCRYYPPSAMDGKACTMCAAEGRE